ncbi:17065_t:CDS:2 [Acaulospora morrowiae]|uniref:17065_t:CDS:1 n=1 Tax=Acaulospora morrowiae TaxID=94023 RepID=A0A9N8VY85_9GLOM|nr:17065_t:CDS:2 [Acaulospora morrowiae]
MSDPSLVTEDPNFASVKSETADSQPPNYKSIHSYQPETQNDRSLVNGKNHSEERQIAPIKTSIVQALRSGAMTMDAYLNNKALLKRNLQEVEQDETDDLNNINEADADDTEKKSTNPHTKPPYTYSSLIGQAILQAPNKKLALCEIYNWITKTYPFFRKENKGWQKIERNDNIGPSKGQYWTIPDEYECCFLNGVYRNIKKPSENVRKSKKAKHNVQDTQSSNDFVYLHNVPQRFGSQQQFSSQYIAPQHDTSPQVASQNTPMTQSFNIAQNTESQNNIVQRNTVHRFAPHYNSTQRFSPHSNAPAIFPHVRPPSPNPWTAQNALQSSSASVLTSQDEQLSSDTTIMSDDLDLTITDGYQSNELTKQVSWIKKEEEQIIAFDTTYGRCKTKESIQTHQVMNGNIIQDSNNNGNNQTDGDKSDYQKIIDWLAQMPDFDELSLQLEASPRKSKSGTDRMVFINMHNERRS